MMVTMMMILFLTDLLELLKLVRTGGWAAPHDGVHTVTKGLEEDDKHLKK